MNNQRKIVLASVLAVIITTSLLGWFVVKKTNQNRDPEVIRVSDSSVPNNFELAKRLTGKDILKEEAVSLKPITIHGAGGGLALLGHNTDVGGGSISIWVNAIGRGAKAKLLLPGSITEQPEQSGLLVLEESNIHTIKDLVGKKIAVNVLGAEADFIIRIFLKQNGLSINQVELVVVPNENQEQVLRSHQVDAVAWTSTGGLQFDRAVENGGVRRISGTSSFETRGGVSQIITVEVFRDDFIKEHPELVRRYLRAVDRARYIVWQEFQKNPDRVRKAYGEISAEKGGNPELAKFYRGVRWSPKHQFIMDSDIQFWIDRFTEAGMFKPGQIKLSDVYTNEFNPLYKN